MANYREITSGQEGRLLVLKGKTEPPSLSKPSDFFLSQPAQRFSVVLRTATPKMLKDVQAPEFLDTNNSVEYALTHSTLSEIRGTSHNMQSDTPSSRISASIILAEPALYVQSYNKVHAEHHTASVLRGLVQLNVPKGEIPGPVCLQLRCIASTEWPESWRLRHVEKVDRYESCCGKTRLAMSPRGSHDSSEQYALDFELPVNSVLPESIDLPMGSVRYEVLATMGEKVLCRQAVKVVRMDCMCSIESAEPWVVTGRQDWVRFFFLFHGSSFRIGGLVPVTVRLSHIAEVKWHHLEIHLVEDTEYSSRNGRAMRIQSKDKGLLLRRQVGGAIRTASHVEVETIAAAAKNMPMAEVKVFPPEIKSLTANAVDVGQRNVTEEVVMDEQLELRLPPCTGTHADQRVTIHHATSYRPMTVRHYLKIIALVTRKLLSGQEMTYELVIRTPIHIVSCKVRETDTLLPPYNSGPDAPTRISPVICACEMRSKESGVARNIAEVEQYWTRARTPLNAPTLPQYAG